MWRHRTPISAVGSHTLTFGSFLIKSFYCPGRCSQLSGYLNFVHNGLQNANGTLTYFVDFFPVIKQEKSSVFDVFSNHYEYAFNEVKIKCQISVNA